MIYARVLSFFTGTMGKTALIIMALLLWTVYNRWDAASQASDECKEEQYLAQVEELQRQLAVSDRIAALSRERADAAFEKLNTTKEQTNAIVEQFKDDNTCVLGDDVLDRLRRIK